MKSFKNFINRHTEERQGRGSSSSVFGRRDGLRSSHSEDMTRSGSLSQTTPTQNSSRPSSQPSAKPQEQRSSGTSQAQSQNSERTEAPRWTFSPHLLSTSQIPVNKHKLFQRLMPNGSQLFLMRASLLCTSPKFRHIRLTSLSTRKISLAGNFIIRRH